MHACILAGLAMLAVHVALAAADDNKKPSPDVEREELRGKLLQMEKTHKAALAKKDAIIEAFKAQLVARDKTLDDAALKAAQDKVNAKAAAAELALLKAEIELLQETLNKRQKRIVTLQDQLAKQQAELVQHKNALTHHLKIVAENERLKQLLKNPAVAPQVELKEPAAKLNPPAKAIKGTVLRIDGVSGLVSLSVGSDHGLKKGQTLEVYRTKPRAEYLGVIQILEVTSTSSVGQRQKSDLPLSPIREGDLVVDKIPLPK